MDKSFVLYRLMKVYLCRNDENEFILEAINVLMRGTSFNEIQHVYRMVCISGWENRNIEIGLLILKLIHHSIKEQFQTSLRPVELLSVMGLFKRWIARHQFQWIDVVLKEMLGRR